MAAQANIKAVITADDRASKTIASVGLSFTRLSGAMAVGQLAANAVSKAFSSMTDVIKSSVGAAFDQVRQVENSTIALRAYEKNGAKVNKVLKDLIAFARSDMGVLFQREDLFAAAQTLKLYGQTTDTLTDKVKILAKGVSLGKTTFQELSSIVGRAAAKGRLDAVDFDMLIERGIGLDKSFRGAKVGSEELFKALDKALPAELLKGRADTIDGAFIRLQSSLRDVGSAILGVDTETSKFIKGGLGDRFMQWVKGVTERLKDPAFKKAVEEWVAKINEFIKNTDWKSIGETLVTIGQTILGVAKIVGTVIGTFNKLKTKQEEVLGFMLYHAQRFVKAFGNVWGKMYGAIVNPMKSAFNAVISLWNNTVGRIKVNVPDWIPGVGGKSFGFPSYAQGTNFHPGGMAMVGERGAELVNLPRGSSVTPNHKLGGMGTVNINVNVGMYAGSEMEKRKMAKELMTAFQEVMGNNTLGATR